MASIFLTVFEDHCGLGTMRFRPSPELSGIEEQRTNQIQDLFGIVARKMAYAGRYGQAEVRIIDGRHAGKRFTVTISESR